MKAREVCGSYPGATPWIVYTDEDSESLAIALCDSAGCESYMVDGICFVTTPSSAIETSE